MIRCDRYPDCAGGVKEEDALTWLVPSREMDGMFVATCRQSCATLLYLRRVQSPLVAA